MKFAIAIEMGAKKTAHGVVVPDLPGCFSAGDTIEDAFDNVKEAIEAHADVLTGASKGIGRACAEVLAEEGKDLPEPLPMSELQSKKEYKGWAWGIVEVPVERFFGPAEKINITVPGRLLKQIDEYAKRHGQTRSGFLANAALEAMRK